MPRISPLTGGAASRRVEELAGRGAASPQIRPRSAGLRLVVEKLDDR
jgi:hypothetical protein